MFNCQVQNHIAMLSWPDTTKANVAFFNALAEQLKTWEADSAVKGIILMGAEKQFLVGPDPKELYQLKNAEQAFQWFAEIQVVLQGIEKSKKPIVATLLGDTIGLGLELALACHYRIASDNARSRFGLHDKPFQPASLAGASQRLSRMIGLKPALPYFLERKKVAVQKAAEDGFIQVVVTPQQVESTARVWIEQGHDLQKPWEKKGFQLPGGSLQAPHNQQILSVTHALVQSRTYGHGEVEQAVLSALYEGLQATFEQGIELEKMYFAQVICSKSCQLAAKTLVVAVESAKKSLKTNTAPKPFKKVGIMGAGMMGTGIALVTSQSNTPVVLVDQTQEIVERAKAYAQTYWEKSKKYSEIQIRNHLEHIQVSQNIEDLKDCDLVIEAVPEDRSLKAQVFQRLEELVSKETIIASNTSTLPITSLARALQKRERFVGLHFFSPVEKMPLLEIIRGKETSEACLARAFDFSNQIGKIPLIVNDGRGFYTSRVFQTYLLEGFRLLAEGVSPALIENTAKLAGMPVGPLALADEVSINLMGHILRATLTDLGSEYQKTTADEVVEKMLQLGRAGKKTGTGFYDYKEGQKNLWPQLQDHFSIKAQQPLVREIEQRLLMIQTIEALRAREEGIISSDESADLGSVFGWGFPAFTGGVISYIDFVGRETFLSVADELKKCHGKRFEVPVSYFN